MELTAGHPVRVLLLAEACNPEWTSVPLVGFNIYKALREVADITLVTHVRNRDALQRRMGPDEPIAFIDSERLARPFHRIGNLLALRSGLGWTIRQATMWLPYLYFERLVYDRFRAQLKRHEFDLIHRITPLSPTYPSPLACWVDIPFVLGPLNGGLPWPKGSTRTRLAEMEWLGYFRGLHRAMPYVRQTYRRAACVIGASRYTLASLPREAQRRSVYIPENGIDTLLFHSAGRTEPSRINPFRIIFVGRLVPYKGADIVLKAFTSSAMLRSNAELVIVGDGPQRDLLTGLAAVAGPACRVVFTGWLPQTEMVREFHRSSVFAFPSIREFGGAVVIEAMACGLPCIVLDYGGPAEIVTSDTGVKLPIASKPEIVAALRAELERLFADRELLDRLSSAGTIRACAAYSWHTKAAQIRAVYDRVRETSAPSRRASTTILA